MLRDTVLGIYAITAYRFKYKAVIIKMKNQDNILRKIKISSILISHRLLSQTGIIKIIMSLLYLCVTLFSLFIEMAPAL